MRSLLSKQELRHLEFLELLMYNNVINLSQVSKATGYPIRTLSKDINIINSYLAPFQIESDFNGIFLKIPKKSSIREIYQLILKQSKSYQILKYLIENEGESQETISKSLFMSLSTFRRMIEFLNACLKEKEIIITSSPFRILGNEENITQLFSALFLELHNDGLNFIKESQRKLLTALCYQSANILNLELNYPDMKRLCILVYVRLLRIKYNHHSKKSENIEICIKLPCLSSDKFKKNFKLSFGIEFDCELVTELFYIFISGSFVKSISDKESLVLSSIKFKTLNKKINLLIKNISESLKIDELGTEKLKVDLFNYLQFSESTQFLLYSKGRAFRKELFANNFYLASKVQTCIESIFFDKYDEYIKDEIFYLIITHWPKLLNKISENEIKIVIGIFFDSDIEHAQMIEDMIGYYLKFNAEVFISKFGDERFLKNICENLDILITDIPNLDVPCSEVICVREYPNAKDWENILNAKERVAKNKISKQSNKIIPL